MSGLVAHIAAVTHQGCVRGHNEDAVAVNGWIQSVPMVSPRQARRALAEPLALLVCDGMGGHAAGEVASDLAVRAISAALSGPLSVDAVRRTVEHANEMIFDAAEAEPSRAEMGTTVAGLWLGGDRVLWFNVGDSSVFRFRGDYLMKLSVDDVAEGGSGAITQALGGAGRRTPVSVHVGDESLSPGTRYLLCSDGLTDVVAFETIEEVLADNAGTAVERLLDLAIAAGAPDNVTIVFVEIASEQDEPEEEASHV
jgi:serine/threonine protein phosphatase PrpC